MSEDRKESSQEHDSETQELTKRLMSAHERENSEAIKSARQIISLHCVDVCKKYSNLSL